MMGTMKKIVISMMVLGAALSSQGTLGRLIYQESFDGTGSALNGDTTDAVGSGASTVWAAGSFVNRDGSFNEANEGGAGLPVSGWLTGGAATNVFEVELSITIGNTWVGLGFTDDASIGSGSDWADRFSNSGGRGWILMRNNGTSSECFQAFAGPNTDGGTGESGTYGSEFTFATGTRYDIRMVYDASAGLASTLVDVYVDNVLVLNDMPVNLSSANFVGFCYDNTSTAQISVDDFKVSVEGPTMGDLAFGTTSPANGAVGITNQPVLEAQIIDVDSQLNTGSVMLSLDGSTLVHSLAQSGGTSTVSAAVSAPLAGYSVHTAQVVAASDEGTLFTNIWSFTIAAPDTYPVLLDDFSGNLGVYTPTRILDANGGTHNTADWVVSGDALELRTTSYDGIEQYALMRDGLSLAVGEEIQAAFSVSGSQDLGLYVGGTVPVTDVRSDFIAVYARADGNVYSRGFDGTGEYGLVGAGAPVFDKLFIRRIGINTYETGYYNGSDRTVIVTRTPATPNSGDVVGFYADVRAAGTLSSIDTLVRRELVVDTDADGLSDPWEQLIADDNPGDAIEDIADVLPGDDYDGDGFTNQQEYDLELDPTTADSLDLDTDGDYLPDLWEVNMLGSLAGNSYDDPDSDGYNNQAERIAGTDPQLDTAHPSWTAPTVAYMRDSVIASNTCLMPGTPPYGNAINGISYQEQILCTFDGYQYSAYYDTVGTVQTVCFARRTVSETAVGEWEIVQTDSAFSNGDESSWDAHNVISFGICPADGTLHFSWDHHNNTLRYRKSVAGLCTTNKAAWGAGMFGAEQNWLVNSSTPETDVTYPQFCATPDGGLVFNRRIGISGNGDQLFQIYNPATGTWNPHVEFISRDGTYTGPNPVGSTVTATERCAYINGLDVDTNGVAHVTWTWRESASQHGNRDICYAFSPDRGTNWYNSAGTHLADTSIGEHITMNSEGITVVPLNMRQLMINQQAQCVDNDGRVHALMLHRRQDPGYEPEVFSKIFSVKFTAYYHYFRDSQSASWTQRRIPPDDYPVGSRPRIGYDAEGNVYAAYLSYPAGIDVFPGYRRNGDTSKLVIASASKASSYTDWAVMQVIDGDFDGEPLFDQNRLLEDGILSVYIQEHIDYTSSSAGIEAPLHVYEFAVDVPEPTAEARINYTAIGDDVVISAYGQTGTNYVLQVSDDLSGTNSWSGVGDAVGGADRLIAFPDADGLQAEKAFYRVISTPAS